MNLSSEVKAKNFPVSDLCRVNPNIIGLTCLSSWPGLTGLDSDGLSVLSSFFGLGWLDPEPNLDVWTSLSPWSRPGWLEANPDGLTGLSSWSWLGWFEANPDGLTCFSNKSDFGRINSDSSGLVNPDFVNLGVFGLVSPDFDRFSNSGFKWLSTSGFEGFTKPCLIGLVNSGFVGLSSLSSNSGLLNLAVRRSSMFSS